MFKRHKLSVLVSAVSLAAAVVSSANVASANIDARCGNVVRWPANSVTMKAVPNGDQVSKPLSYDKSLNAAFYYPRSTRTFTNEARRGDTIEFQACFGNLGSVALTGETVTVLLSTDAVPSSNDVVLKTLTNLLLFQYSSGCTAQTAVIPNSTSVINGTNYILFTNGTGPNDIALLDRPLTITN
jgi:hypothetical protein